jgi:hypothetical protein
LDLFLGLEYRLALLGFGFPYCFLEDLLGFGFCRSYLCLGKPFPQPVTDQSSGE